MEKNTVYYKIEIWYTLYYMTERMIGYQLKHSKEINQTLYNDSEKSLWNFANTPLGTNELKTWKARFQSLVISRLQNRHDNNSYFQSISMTINSLQKPENKDEEMIALYSALLSYDFSHFDKLPDDTPYYNKSVFMRLFLSHRIDQNQIGENIQKCLDGMTLDTISQPLLNTKLKLHNTDRIQDCALLSDIALERQETEPGQAQLILDTVVKAFIKQWGKDNNAYNTVGNLLQYSKKSREYIFNRLYQENHPYMSTFFTLYEKYTIKGIQTLFNQSVCLQTIYNKMKEKIAYQHPQAQLATEKQKELEEQETLKERQTRIAQFYIHLLPDLKGRSFEKNNIRPETIYDLTERGYVPMTHRKSNLFYDEHKMSRVLSFDFLSEEVSFFTSDESLISSEEKNQLKVICENNQKRLLMESENTYRNKAVPFICKTLLQDYTFHPDFIIYKYPKFQEMYNSLQKQYNSLNERTEESYRFAINEILSTVEQIKPNIEKTYETTLQRQNEEEIQTQKKAKQKRVEDEQREKQEEGKEKEEERKENIYELKKERLLEDIENKTEYLKSLYTLHTGLDLHDVDVEALDESGTTIGSVSVGLSQRPSLSQRQELTLEQRLEFRSKRDLIELEVGEDTEKIIQRFSMIDWVAPHEIAHLIDWASNHFSEKLLESQIMQNKIKTIARAFDPVKQALAKEMIALSFKESLIDGIGFYCASEYGTSDIAHDQDRKKRKQDISTAFSTTMEIVKTIIREEAHDEESQSRYQIILLRMITVSKQVSADQKTTTLLESAYDKLNQKTNLISDEQKNTLIALFTEAFDGGTQLLENN